MEETKNISEVTIETEVVETEEKVGIVKKATGFLGKHKGKIIAGVVGVGAVALGAVKLLSNNDVSEEDFEN